jgi:hypothetical protein
VKRYHRGVALAAVVPEPNPTSLRWNAGVGRVAREEIKVSEVKGK